MRRYIFWGMFFIIFGILWLLKNAAILVFSWYDLFSLWPLIIVWIGIGLLPIPKVIKGILDVLALMVGLYLVLSTPTIWGGFHTFI